MPDRAAAPARRSVLSAGLAAACLPVAGGGCAPAGAGAGDQLRIMVPTVAGGGYDFTARTVAVTLREAGLADDVEVFSLTGGAGTVALTRLVHERGNDRLLLQMGLGLVGVDHTTEAPAGVADATPLARLADETEAVVVPAGSPYRSFARLVGDWRRGRVTAGIGSGLGGPDYLALMLIAEAAGLAPRDVQYEGYDGGGGLLAALLSRRVDFVVSSVSEYGQAVAARQLRVLAVTSPRRVAGIDAPTLRELGYDLAMTNWRGLLAPPGLTAGQRAGLVDLLRRLHASPEWRRARRDAGWHDSFLAGDGFARFLAAERRRVGALLDRFTRGRGTATAPG